MLFKSISVLITVLLIAETVTSLAPPKEPTHYKLWLKIDEEGTKSVEGKVDISVNVNEYTNNIAVNCKDLDINTETAEIIKHVEGEDDVSVPIDRIHIDPNNDDESCIVIAQEPLEIGTYTLRLEWEAPIHQTGNTGLFQVNYEIPGQIVTIRRKMILTNFKATYARSVFPCFDDPKFQAPITLTLVYKRFFKALSVGKVKFIDTEGDWATAVFNPTPSIPTYLFGLVVYHSERGTGLPRTTIDNRIVINAPSTLANQSLLLIPFANQSLSAYQSYFGNRLQPEEFNVVAVPFPMDFIIENLALVVVDKDKIINAPLVSNPRDFQNSLQLFSNQFGLNWLGKDVTVEDWRYIWLTSGLNKLLEFVIPSQGWQGILLGEVINWKHFSVAVTQKAFDIDDEEGVEPMEKELKTPSEINARFDDVITFKSAAVLNTIRNALTEEEFDTTLKQFVNEKKGSVNPNDFFNSFSPEVVENLPASLEQIFDSWTKQIGYPTIEVSLSGTEIRVQVDPVLSGRYYTPVNFALASNLNFTTTTPDFWLGPEMESHVITIVPNDFAIFNKQQSGYYRVYYDDQSLEPIIKHMATVWSTVHPVNRGQLVDDQAHFAFKGDVGYDQFFDLINYIEREDHYIPWLVLKRRLSEIHQRLKGWEAFDRFETYLREKTANLFNEWGIGGITIRHRTRFMRESVSALACTAGNEICVNETLTTINKLIKNESPDGITYPELFPIIACTAFKYDDTLLGRIMGMVSIPAKLTATETNNDTELTNDKDEKISEYSYQSDLEYLAGLFGISPSLLEQLSKSIGCSRNQGSLQAMLDLTIVPNSQLRFGREIRRKLYTVIVQGNYIGAKLGLKFMHDNYLAMNQRYDDMAKVFKAFEDHIHTEELQALYNNVLEKHGFRFYPEHVKIAAEEASKQISKNIDWANEHVPEIEAWLIENNFEPTERPVAPPEEKDGNNSVLIWTIVGVVAGVIVLIVATIVVMRLRK